MNISNQTGDDKHFGIIIGLAERKAVNKYYPPDWDPSKGSVNKHVGQHPLRDRAKKIGQGILVIRFELPYNIWCGGCNSHVGMGVRYNAEKQKVGNYYTTPIWKFRMKCHLCDNYFEIQTDPKNHDYVILNGARRKEQRWDPKENEQVVPEDKATQKKMALDAMYKLEHGSDDVKQGQSRKQNLVQLEDRLTQFKDDYMLNKLARNKFRGEKKAIKESEALDKDLQKRASLDIPLAPENTHDIKLAGLMKYGTTGTYEEKQAQKRKAIDNRPLFWSGGKKLCESHSPSKNSTIQKLKRTLSASLASTKTSTLNDFSTEKTTVFTAGDLGIKKKSVKSKSSASLIAKEISRKSTEPKDSGSLSEKVINQKSSNSNFSSSSSDLAMRQTSMTSNCFDESEAKLNGVCDSEVEQSGKLSVSFENNSCDNIDTSDNNTLCDKDSCVVENDREGDVALSKGDDVNVMRTSLSLSKGDNINVRRTLLSPGLGLMAAYSDSSSSDDNT